MECAESLRTQAYFDDQVDALAAAEIEQHIAECAQCSALIQALERIRSAARADLPGLRAPPMLRARLLHMIDEEPGGARHPTAKTPKHGWRTRPFWLGALGGAAASAAASCALLFISATTSRPLLDELITAHVQSLMPEHLIDVVSTDQHTVKPWFSGHADVSPLVADFKAQGYRLIGGRADYIDRQRSAVVVYRHGPHVINVFSWARRTGDLPQRSSRNGYHISCWQAADLQYCAVSDAGWAELHGLVAIMKNSQGATE